MFKYLPALEPGAILSNAEEPPKSDCSCTISVDNNGTLHINLTKPFRVSAGRNVSFQGFRPCRNSSKYDELCHVRVFVNTPKNRISEGTSRASLPYLGAHTS